LALQAGSEIRLGRGLAGLDSSPHQRGRVVVEQFRVLLRVQDLDGKIRDAEQEIAGFAPRRADAAGLEAKDAAATEAARTVAGEREAEHRRFESELAVVDALVEKFDAQVYEVTSKHAMEVIQSELAAAQAKKSELEDRILELLDEVEAAEQEVAARDAAAGERAAENAREDEEMSRREPELRGEIEQRQAERVGEISGVEAEVLRGYEEARRRAWPVLVHATKKSCPTCRIVIAPQKWVEISTVRALVTCGSCHRILYGDKVSA
jgi:predicted  nucleic acid-binding Zn-ribbon protein